jgi:phage baseplate assembly protein W
MADSLGTDLLVVPTMAAHDAASIDLVRKLRPVRRPAPGTPDELADLEVVDGRRNLAQALILRLLTPRGSLASLGHAGYGSQLHTLVGRLKTDELRNLCRAFVLEVVAQEPRVEDTAVALEFDSSAEDPSSFVFTLVVQPKFTDEPVGLTLEVAL